MNAAWLQGALTSETMTFRYENHEAVDGKLGLRIRRDHGYRESGFEGLQLTDLESGQGWSFSITYEKGLLTYNSAEGPRTYMGELACRISRKHMEWIVRQLAPLKAAQGHRMTPEHLLEAIRAGVFAFLAEGGRRLINAPDFHVDWDR